LYYFFLSALLFLITVLFTESHAMDSSYVQHRHINVLHYSIDLDLTSTFEFRKSIFDAKVTLKIKPEIDNLDKIILDAVSLSIDSIYTPDSLVAFDFLDSTIIISTGKAYNRNDTIILTIAYKRTELSPANTGFHFYDKSEVTYEPAAYIISYKEKTKYWLPCIDDAGDKALTDMRIKVPTTYSAISNGVLIKEETEGDGSRIYYFENKNPISSYCISLAVSRFSNISENLTGNENVSLYYWNKDSVNSRVMLNELTKFYRSYIQLFDLHPFPELKLILIKPFPFTAYSVPGMIFLKDMKPPEDSSFEQSLYLHEICHQWFGSAVNTFDWSDPLSHEFFSEYRAAYYLGGLYGDEFIRGKHNSSILQMLRYMTGENTFLNIFRVYLNRYKYANASSEDFIGIVNELTGIDYDWFFDQWVYDSGVPVYNIFYVYDESTLTLDLTIEQTQTSRNCFIMPVEFLIRTAEGDTLIKVFNNLRKQSFQLRLSSAPLIITFDPEEKIMIKELNGVTEVADKIAAHDFALSQNYPNPFNSSTNIEFEISEHTNISLLVFDLLGNEVSQIFDEQKTPGKYKVAFERKELPSGIYFYILKAGKYSSARKMILLK